MRGVGHGEHDMVSPSLLQLAAFCADWLCKTRPVLALSTVRESDMSRDCTERKSTDRPRTHRVSSKLSLLCLVSSLRNTCNLLAGCSVLPLGVCFFPPPRRFDWSQRPDGLPKPRSWIGLTGRRMITRACGSRYLLLGHGGKQKPL